MLDHLAVLEAENVHRDEAAVARSVMAPDMGDDIVAVGELAQQLDAEVGRFGLEIGDEAGEAGGVVPWPSGYAVCNAGP